MKYSSAQLQRARLEFGAQAIAVTSGGSELNEYGAKECRIVRIPMWDWVGGRTSKLLPVGLLPAALQRFDINAILAGAKACDQVTRDHNVKGNGAPQNRFGVAFAVNDKGASYWASI